MEDAHLRFALTLEDSLATEGTEPVHRAARVPAATCLAQLPTTQRSSSNVASAVAHCFPDMAREYKPHLEKAKMNPPGMGFYFNPGD